MNAVPLLAVLTALVVGTLRPTVVRAAEDDGVALAIIYDTSGSMREQVRDKNGQLAAKYVIANRALIAVTERIRAFATNISGSVPRKIHAGLFIFRGTSAREVVKFGPFDPAPIKNWARQFASPNGNTPLGNSLDLAARTVLNSPLSRKHVLILTDGINTAGPRPANVLPMLQQVAGQQKASLSVHFVAFDVDAKVFDEVKKLGATVVGAADEAQLNSQLEYILQRKILLEDEEPKK